MSRYWQAKWWLLQRSDAQCAVGSWRKASLTCRAEPKKAHKRHRLTLELTFKKFQEVWIGGWETIQKGAAETKKQRYKTANWKIACTGLCLLVSERSDFPEYETEFILPIAFSLKCIKFYLASSFFLTYFGTIQRSGQVFLRDCSSWSLLIYTNYIKYSLRWFLLFTYLLVVYLWALASDRVPSDYVCTQ